MKMESFIINLMINRGPKIRIPDTVIFKNGDVL